MLTSELVRAGRALIRWEQKDLAEASKVSLPSIKRLETQPGPLAAQTRTVDAIRAALESAGVIFVAENGEGPGVRLRKADPTKAEIKEHIQELQAAAEAIPVAQEPSPEAALDRMDKALIENEIAELKGQRKRVRKPK